MVAGNFYYLTTPKSSIKNFVNREDRLYFSKPIQVQFLRVDDVGLVWVRDPHRDHTYPCMRQNLTSYKPSK